MGDGEQVSEKPASFNDLKSQGKLPEGVRDEQDYQEYLEMEQMPVLAL